MASLTSRSRRGPAQPAWSERSGPEEVDRHLTLLQLSAIVGVVLFLTVGSAGLAYLLAGMGEQRYAAEVQILYDAPASGANLDQELATQEVLLQSRAVLASVAQDADIRVQDLQDALTVDVVGGSQVLHLRLEHEDPQIASQQLDLIADRYVLLTADAAQGETDRSQEIITQRVAETEAALGELVAQRDQLALERELAEGETGTPPAGVVERNLEAEILRFQQRLSSLQDRAVTLELERASVASARPLHEVYVLADPVAPRPLQAAAAGALAGLVIALTGVALFLRRMRA